MDSDPGGGGGVAAPPTAPTGDADHRRRLRPSLVGVGPRSAATATARAVWVAGALVLAVVAVVTSAALGARQWHQPTFNALDEQGHYDYVVYLSHGEIPKWGDLYTRQTVDMLNCLGIARTATYPCISNNDPKRYPPDGYSYEAQQPPLGYLPYIPFLKPGASPAAALAAARRGGVVWLGAGAVLLVAMAWLADMTLLQTALVLSVCLLNPSAVRSAAIVSNDSSALAAGAASMVMVQIGRWRRSTMLVPALLVGAAIGLTKSLYCVAPLAIVVGGMLTERRFGQRFSLRALWRRRGCELSLLAGAVIATVAFTLFQDLRAITPSKVVLHALLGGRVTARPRWSTLEGSIQNGFSVLLTSPNQPLYTLWNLLLYGSVLALALNRRTSRGKAQSALATGAITGLMVLALGFSLLDYLQGHFDYVTPGRYVLVLAPLLAYLAAKSLRTSGVIVVGLVLPVLAVVSTTIGHPY